MEKVNIDDVIFVLTRTIFSDETKRIDMVQYHPYRDGIGAEPYVLFGETIAAYSQIEGARKLLKKTRGANPPWEIYTMARFEEESTEEDASEQRP